MNKNKHDKITVMIKKLVLTLFFFTSISFAEPDATNIMQAVHDQLNKHSQLKFKARMEISNHEGNVRNRFFITYKKKVDKETKILMKFFKPRDVKGTGLLTYRKEGAIESKQKIYLPALRRVLNIGGSDKNKSFMGSDFTNDDMGGRNIEMDQHSLDRMEGTIAYVKSVPVSETSLYTYLLNKVDTDRNVILAVEYYDSNGMLKSLVNEKIDMVDGMLMPVLSQMKHHRRNSSTKLIVSDIDTTSSISDRFFGIKGLRK